MTLIFMEKDKGPRLTTTEKYFFFSYGILTLISELRFFSECSFHRIWGFIYLFIYLPLEF